jgi:hypothetical protein
VGWRGFVRELAAPLEIQPLVQPARGERCWTLLRLLDSFVALDANSHLVMRCAAQRTSWIA